MKIDMCGEILDTATIGGIPIGEEDDAFETLKQTLKEVLNEREQGGLPENNSIIADMYQIIKKLDEGRDIAGIKRDMIISQNYYPHKQKYRINASGETTAQEYERDITGEDEIRSMLKKIKERPSLFPVNAQTICESILSLDDDAFYERMKAGIERNFGVILGENLAKDPKEGEQK